MRFGVAAAKTLNLKRIPFLFNGDAGTVKNLKPLQVVKVILAPDRKKVLEVQAGKGVGYANPYCRNINQSGYLLKKDDARKIIQIGTIADRTRLLEFTYDAWTGVRLVYSTFVLRTASMDVVDSPAKINLYFESDRQRVSSLSVEVPLISRCLVKSYDKEKRCSHDPHGTGRKRRDLSRRYGCDDREGWIARGYAARKDGKSRGDAGPFARSKGNNLCQPVGEIAEGGPRIGISSSVRGIIRPVHRLS